MIYFNNSYKLNKIFHMEISKAIYKLQSKFRYNSNDIISKSSNSRDCILFKYDKQNFIISAAHNINSLSYEYIAINDKYIKLSKKNKYIINEIDLVIWDVTSNSLLNKLELYDIENNKYTINDIDDKTELFLKNANNAICSTNILFMEKTKYNNFCYPEMLKYFAKLVPDIDGSSGTPIYDDNNNIYGILSGYNIKYLNITPFFFVKRILDEIIKYNSFSGLCKFWHENSISKRNLVITKKESIDYNIYHKIFNDNFNKLYKNDELIKFDDKLISNGLIHCDLINIDIDIDSYISITKTIHDTNFLNVYRNKNLKNKLIDIKIGNRDISSSYNININKTILNTIKIKDNIYGKISSVLFNYICNYRPVFEDNQLIKHFKLKNSEIYSNEYILLKNKHIDIFSEKYDNYFIIKM